MTSPRWSVSTATKRTLCKGVQGTQESRQQEQGAYKKECRLLKETTLNALVSQCDGFGYDWSDQAEEGIVALGAIPVGWENYWETNCVLFTDTACVVLSPDFKLTNESQSDNGIEFKNRVGISFVNEGYSTNNKAFRVFNSRTRIVEENLHVQFSENTPNIAGSGPNWLFDIDALTKSMNYKPVVARNQSNGSTGTKACDNAGKARMETIPGKDYILLPLSIQDPPFSSSLKDSPDAGFKPLGEEEKKDAEDTGNKSGNPTEGKDSEVSSIEEPRINQEKDDNINSTNNINTASDGNNTNNVNTVSSTVNDDEDVGAEADINNLDTNIHMDVQRRAFLYGRLKRKSYVCQHQDLKIQTFPDRVYKEKGSLWFAIKLPRAWYETLSTYLLDNGFQRGKIEKTLFIRRDKSDILLVQVYVDDIIFGSTKNSLCTEFEKMMHKKFQMSSIGELTFFLGLASEADGRWIFISKTKVHD
ncbi:putative ribonuclease H-like domain-containing protein [Tanacetum coccineum]